MTIIETKLFEGSGSELSRVTLSLMYVPVTVTGTLKGVYLRVGANLPAGSAVFNIRKDGVALWTGDERLEITSGNYFTTKTGLNISVTRGMRLDLDLEVYPDGGMDAPVTLILDVDDGNAYEPAITAGMTAQYWRGDKTWQSLFADVRAATLTGLSLATNAAISAADTVLSALGKLQKQITDLVARSISAGTGLTGGGDLSANRTLSLDINSLTTDDSPDGAADYVAAYDASAGTHKKVLLNNLPGSGGSSLPSQTGNDGKFLKTDGAAASWQTAPGSGESAKVSDNAGEARTSTSTPTNHGTLHFGMLANKSYKVRISVPIWAQGAGGFRWTLAAPSGGFYSGFYNWAFGNTTSTPTFFKDPPADVGLPGTSALGHLYIDFTYRNRSNAGEFYFQFAQNSSDGTPSYTLEGALIEYLEI